MKTDEALETFDFHNFTLLNTQTEPETFPPQPHQGKLYPVTRASDSAQHSLLVCSLVSPTSVALHCRELCLRRRFDKLSEFDDPQGRVLIMTSGEPRQQVTNYLRWRKLNKFTHKPKAQKRLLSLNFAAKLSVSIFVYDVKKVSFAPFVVVCSPARHFIDGSNKSKLSI
jgi:hypothetical protein